MLKRHVFTTEMFLHKPQIAAMNFVNEMKPLQYLAALPNSTTIDNAQAARIAGRVPSVGDIFVLVGSDYVVSSFDLIYGMDEC